MILCLGLLTQPVHASFESELSDFLNTNAYDNALNQPPLQYSSSFKSFPQKRVLSTPAPVVPHVPPVVIPDPCAEYEDTQNQICKRCIATYELIIFNTTKIICGKLIVDSGDEICNISALEYPGEYAFYQNAISNSFIKNEKRLLFTRQAAGSIYKNYCVNQQLYYLRWKSFCNATSNPKFSVPSGNASFCALSVTTFPNLTDDSTILGIAMDNQMTCYVCSYYDMLYPDLRLKWYPLFGAWGAVCIPQNPSNNCTATPYVAAKRPVCEISSLYNSVTKRCQYCGETMPRCSYCESYTNCTICRKNQFWNINGTYQYLPNVTDVNVQRRQECMFDMCSQGFCQNYQTRTCDLKAPTLTNCLKCNVQTANTTTGGPVQLCQICVNGYIQSADSKSCVKLPAVEKNLVYFVKAFDKLLFRVGTLPLPQDNNSTILQCAREVTPLDLFINIDPTNIDKAAPMLQVALRKLYMNENSTSNVTATIYIAKGTHFFISCRGDEANMYAYTFNYSRYIFKYCEEYDLYRYNYNAHDNWYLTIQAMECQFGKALGLDSNPQFFATCVDFSKGDPKPTIYVTDLWTGFNITGRLTVKNLKFSGIQMLVKQTQQLTMSFNLYPQNYCQSKGEPRRNIDNLDLNNLTTCVNLISNLTHTCDLDYKVSVPDKTKKSSTTCDNNAQATFFHNKASTLKCKGEMYSDDYYSIHMRSNTYSKRRRSLFNLYSFADHKTLKKEVGPPELIIDNTDFEYFLKDTMESLIYIESQSVSRVSVAETTVSAGVSKVSNLDYYQFDGADRGAKILITDSTFKHSLSSARE